MPPDSSKAAAAQCGNNLKRDAEELKYNTRKMELKRSSGKNSCAECYWCDYCIRCDRTIPCQSCQCRGCAALCPNDSLVTGQGTRFVFAATAHLHRRLAKMSERIRQLEDVLAIMQAKDSNQPHPLLTDGMSEGKGMDDGDGILAPDQPIASPGDMIAAHGVFSTSNRGVSRFFGPTGGTEYLLFSGSDVHLSHTNLGSGPEIRPLPDKITRLLNVFPFTPMGPPHHISEPIEDHLPPYSRAYELADSYVNHAAWLFRSVPRSQLFDEMLPHYYKQAGKDALLPQNGPNPHDLALLLLCFAIGALMDLTQQPYSLEGEHYYQLAQASMCLRPIFSNPTLVTIQALHLQSIYVAMVGNQPEEQDNQMELSRALVSLAGQLSHTIGLHHDSARFGFPSEVIERRRVIFWDLFVADAWQSLVTGRPPAMQREYIDCKVPTPPVAPDDQGSSEQRELAFETWSFKFALNCVAEVVSKTLTAEAPPYATIMELDRKLREFQIPLDAAALQEELEVPPNSEPQPLQESMIRFVLAHTREVVLLFLHRNFFAQAIFDCPQNPLRSIYAPSFLAAYRSSSTVLKVIRDQFKLYPIMCARFWMIWTSAFSAAAVFATLVTQGSRSAMAPQALTQLDQAYELFTQASKHNRRAAKALFILQRLRDRAHCAFTAAQNQPTGNTMYKGSLWNIKPENADKDEDELNIFASRTALVPTPQQHGNGLPLITPIPIAPISGRANDVLLADPWPSVHLQLSTSGGNSHMGPGQSQSSQPTQPALDAPQQPFRLNFLQPAQPPPPQSQSSYQWVPGHWHWHSPSGPGAPSQSYGPQPSFAGADSLQPYAGQGYPQQQHQPYAPPSELVSLGLGSRHERLDERWTTFTHENGFL